MSLINFFTEDSNYQLRNKKLIRQWISDTAKSEKYSIETINLIFTSDNYLHQLNVEHLNHDTLTDIITFEYNEPNEAISSDIFISIDRVKENATNFNQLLHNELHRIIIHGVLHLLGFKDKTKTDKEEMTSKEDYYLSLRPEKLL